MKILVWMPFFAVALICSCATAPETKAPLPPAESVVSGDTEPSSIIPIADEEVPLPDAITQGARACGVEAAKAPALTDDERKRAESKVARITARVDAAFRLQHSMLGWNADWDPSRVGGLQTSLVKGGAKFTGSARSFSDVAEFATRAQSLGPVWISSAVGEESFEGDTPVMVFGFTIFVGAYPDVGNPWAPLDLSGCANAEGDVGKSATKVVQRHAVEHDSKPKHPIIAARLEASRTSTDLVECASRVMFRADGFSIVNGEIRVVRPDIAVPECKGIKTSRDEDEVVMSAIALAQPKDGKTNAVGQQVVSEQVPQSPDLERFIERTVNQAATADVDLEALETTLWESRVDHVRYRLKFRFAAAPMEALTWLYYMTRMQRTLRIVQVEYSDSASSVEFEVYSTSVAIKR